MKHTIEIEGLPEGYEVKNIKVTEKQPWDNGSIAALIYVKKKQPRRIVLEEITKHGDYFLYFEDRYWRIVEDSGENDD